MTQKEKTVLVSLVFFLMVGIAVRAVQRHYSKVEFVVDSKRFTEQNEKFETVRLQLARMDINQAQEKDFEQLPGVGPKLAQAIVQYRSLKGKFSEPQEMMQVKGFGKERYEKLQEILLVDGKPAFSTSTVKQKSGNESSPSPNRIKAKTKQKLSRTSDQSTSDQKVNINNASVEELAALPHIGRKLAEQIVSYRKMHGPFKEKNELLKIKGMSVPLYNKIGPFLTLR